MSGDRHGTTPPTVTRRPEGVGCATSKARSEQGRRLRYTRPATHRAMSQIDSVQQHGLSTYNEFGRIYIFVNKRCLRRGPDECPFTRVPQHVFQRVST